MNNVDQISTPEIERLNQHFYKTNPASYFKRRLNNVMLAAGRPDEIEDLLSTGATYGGVTVQLEGSSPAVDTEAADASAFYRNRGRSSSSARLRDCSPLVFRSRAPPRVSVA